MKKILGVKRPLKLGVKRPGCETTGNQMADGVRDSAEIPMILLELKRVKWVGDLCLVHSYKFKQPSPLFLKVVMICTCLWTDKHRSRNLTCLTRPWWWWWWYESSLLFIQEPLMCFVRAQCKLNKKVREIASRSVLLHFKSGCVSRMVESCWSRLKLVKSGMSWVMKGIYLLRIRSRVGHSRTKWCLSSAANLQRGQVATTWNWLKTALLLCSV